MTLTPYADGRVVAWHADVLAALPLLPDASVDAVVTDPPYGLGFMGKEWDDLPPGRPFAEQCLRVLKPGSHLLAFGGSRTWHRLAVAVEDAGFEIRDSIAWLYGSGFPKSLDVSKAIDKAAGAERAVVGERVRPDGSTRVAALGGAAGSALDGSADGTLNTNGAMALVTAPATEAARQWQGWGTALKPAFEPIVVARKPLAGTVAANVLEHGTGALNVDACRIDWDADSLSKDTARRQAPRNDITGGRLLGGAAGGYEGETASPSGRWPTNVVLDAAAAAELDEQTGTSTSRAGKPRAGKSGEGWRTTATGAEYEDQGGASRFFPTFRYQAKAPSKERPKVDGIAHPTVKPLELMRWLVRLVTPPDGLVLDPFAGSGTTGEAALAEGFRALLIEREADYLPLIAARMERGEAA